MTRLDRPAVRIRRPGGSGRPAAWAASAGAASCAARWRDLDRGRRTVIGPDGSIRRRSRRRRSTRQRPLRARRASRTGRAQPGHRDSRELPAARAGDTPASVQAGGEDWRTVTRACPTARALQVAARLEPLQDRRAPAAAGRAAGPRRGAARDRARDALARAPRARAARAPARDGGRRRRHGRPPRSACRSATGPRRSTRSPATSTRCSPASAPPPTASEPRSKARGASPPTPATSCAPR